jgi:hypothetical protein
MISKLKIAAAAPVAVVALGVFGVAPALAEWLINGTPLTGSAALSTQALVDADSTLLVPTLKLSIQCSGRSLDLLSPQISGDKWLAKGVTFLACIALEPQHCELIESNNTPISTEAILVLASLGRSRTVNVRVTPEKSRIGSINFSEENLCAFNSQEPITGEFVTNFPTGQLSLSAQALTGLGSTEGNNSLRIDGDPAFIDGGWDLLTLASGSKWSFD